MAEETSGEKTHDPTAKRQEDAAKKGDVWQSKELASALSIVVLALWIAMAGDWFVQSTMAMLAGGLTFDQSTLEKGSPASLVAEMLAEIVGPFALLLVGTILAAIAGPAMLGSLRPRWSAMEFKASRLNPMSGMKRMFGPQGLIELAKAVAKVVLLGGISIWVVYDATPKILATGMADPRAALLAVAPLVALMIAALAGGLVVIALIDVPVTWAQRRKRLMMSDQEMRDEHKESEGSPEKKMAIRSRQMAILSQSARAGVKDASVVLVNPAHFAVALRYRPGEDAAPIVTARGSDAMAAAIRELAAAEGVPVVRQVALARALYFTSKAGSIIDQRLYLAVASLLALLWRMDRAADQWPALDVPEDLRFDEAGAIAGR